MGEVRAPSPPAPLTLGSTRFWEGRVAGVPCLASRKRRSEMEAHPLPVWLIWKSPHLESTRRLGVYPSGFFFCANAGKQMLFPLQA